MKNTFGSLFASAFVYAILGVSGLALAIPPGYASPVFPAAGLAVALALYFGNRILPGIWLGSLTVNIVVAWQQGKLDTTSIIIAGVVAGGAVLQTWAARWMIQRWLGDRWRRLETEKDIALFLVLGALLACLLSATIGTCALYVSGVIKAEGFFYSWWNWWTGDTLGVLVFAPLTLILLFRKDSAWKERQLTVALPMLLTLCLVVVSFLGASHRQQEQQLDEIEDHGKDIAQLLDLRFVAHQEALYALKRLIEVMPDMTFQQFEHFTQITLQDNKDIFALSFNPYIHDSLRGTFEQTMTKALKAPFRITERDSLKQLVLAPSHPFYVPVGFIAPLEGNRPAIGFNINAEAIRHDAIDRAITSQKPAVTAPIQLVQEAQKRVGVLILIPAYRNERTSKVDNTENLIGFAVGVFKIDETAQIAVKKQVPTGIVFRLIDQLADADRRLLFQSDGGQNQPTDQYVWRTQLTIADREWTLEVFPIEAYLHQQHSSLALVIGVTGLLFAALLQLMLLAMTGRTSVIKEKVSEQTLQLKQSFAAAKKTKHVIAEKKEELELVIEGAQLGTWNWNIVSDRLDFNEIFCTMLGYKADELKYHINIWRDLLHPDDKAYVFAVLQEHLDGTTLFYSTEHRLRHKSGQWIWVHNAGKVVQRDQAGKPLRAFGIHLNITERKETVGLLTTAKEEADTIIRNFLDTLIVVNTSLSVIRVNQATCDLLGFSEKELLGRSVFELFHDAKEYVQSVFAFYIGQTPQHMKNKQELRNVELCYRAKDGAKLPMSFNIRLLLDDEGRPTGVVAGAKDISSLMAAIDKIASQKKYIENLFDVVPEGLLAISPSMEIVESNRAFRQIIQTWAAQFELAESELTGGLLAKFKESLSATGETLENRERAFALTYNGITAYLQYNATPILSPQGIEHVVSLRDITEKRKTEAARKLLATVIEQTADTVIITEPDGVILYVNPAALQTSGYSKSELLGRKASMFKSEQPPPETFQELWQTITQGNVWSGRITNKKKDNTPIEEDVTISPVRNEEGEITNFVAIKRDVTKMDLLQRQLLQAQKMVAIGQLAAGIAHEINTPMQYVQNNVTFFERAFKDIALLVGDYQKLQGAPGIELSREARKHLDDINLDFLMEEIPESISETHGGINRVVQIVSAMQEFSHPGNNDKTATDLNHALENTINVSRNEWKYVAEMDTDFDPDLPMVHCLPDQLNQAFLNLIINGAQAIAETGASVPSNPGRISISTRHDDKWVEIRVSDTGGGIPEEIRERIFDPFFTTKQVGKGTGQGLSIIHDVVVQKHGGSIDFISAPDKGTTFILRLPIKTIKNDEVKA
jgi:PAS domain S-box-containing protein